MTTRKTKTGGKPFRRTVTERQVDIVLRRYRAGKSIREAAADAGVAYSTAHRMLVDADVERRPRTGRPKKTETS